MAYHNGQPFNKNHLRPCPMLENPERLPEMVKRAGAHSTDLEAPESAEHLCDKCHAYAACWKPEAEQLWAEESHEVGVPLPIKRIEPLPRLFFQPIEKTR